MAKLVKFHGCPLGSDVDSEAPLPDMLALFDSLRPKASPKPLIRIGADEDGAYLLPDDLEGITACFSPGVNNFKTFEDALVDGYGVDCHMCDFTSDEHRFRTPMKAGKQTFIKKWLDIRGDETAVRLDDWVAERAPQGDLLLQIDIEGAEYRNLLAVSDEVLARFRIIIIELHDLGMMTSGRVLRDVLKPFFDKLDRLFVNVHAHPNNCCGTFTIANGRVEIPNVLEVTYLRRDRVNEARHPPLLPHPLDVSFNVRRKDPVFLGEAWLDGPRPLESQIKMLEVERRHRNRVEREWRLGAELRQTLLARAIETRDRGAATPPPAPDLLREVAEDKPYRLSSAYRALPETGVVKEQGDYFFQTGGGIGEYIMIDLGDPTEIHGVRLWNRKDRGFARACSLFAIVSNEPDPTTGDVVVIPDDEKFLSGERRTVRATAPGLIGRYVFIQCAARSSLNLSKLEIYAV